MKPETLIFDKVRSIIPENSEKTVFFIGITDTSEEVFFYSFINGEAVQCYTLAEQYELDENDLDKVFSEVVHIIRESKYYTVGKYNVGTIVVDKSGIQFKLEPHDMEESEYRIQKEWKQKNIDL